jgi:outer membrane protein assembly factor BamD (BamD/ComL family)
LIDSYPSSEYLDSGLYALGYAWQKVAAHEQALNAFQQLLQRFPIASSIAPRSMVSRARS